MSRPTVSWTAGSGDLLGAALRELLLEWIEEASEERDFETDYQRGDRAGVEGCARQLDDLLEAHGVIVRHKPEPVVWPDGDDDLPF